MRTLLLGAPLLVAATTATASAQPVLAPLSAPAQPAPVAPRARAGRKDPGVATLLSIAGTVVPTAALFAAGSAGSAGGDVFVASVIGMELGPSLGHWYAGDYLTAGLGLRAGGTALVVAGLSQAFDCNGDSCRSSGTAPAAFGAALFASGVVYDIATAGHAANAWNTGHLQLAPTTISSAGHATVGVGLGGSF